MNSNKVTGFEALSYVTSVMLAEESRIIEHNAGIDIDNGARGYDHERVTDFEHLFWLITMYAAGLGNMPSGYTADDLFSLEYVTERSGGTDVKALWFHIHEDIYDGESRGTHFQFLYPTTEYKDAHEVYSGDEIDLSDETDGEYDWQTDGEYDWQTVDSKWVEYHNVLEREQVWFEFEDAGVAQYDPTTRVKVRTWR